MTRIARAMFLATLLLSGCSIKKFAINKLGDSLANSGTTFASDDDPEFIGQAAPFSLKLIEGLIAESPKHRGLLFAASSGFALTISMCCSCIAASSKRSAATRLSM